MAVGVAVAVAAVSVAPEVPGVSVELAPLSGAVVVVSGGSWVEFASPTSSSCCKVSATGLT